MGLDYSTITLERIDEKLYISHTICKDAGQGGMEETVERIEAATSDLYLKLFVEKGGECWFAYSDDGRDYHMMKETFTARPGKWIGAKVGLFACSHEKTNDMGYADYDWFRIE